MKKILILALTAVASLGLTFGTALAFSADETYISSLDDLLGHTIVWKDEPISVDYAFQLSVDFESNGMTWNSFGYRESHGDPLIFYSYIGEGSPRGYEYYIGGAWEDEYQEITFTGDTITNTSIDPEATDSYIIDYINNNIKSYTTNETPAEAPTMWQAILSGIGGFFSGMFSVLNGLFSGVVEVFYTNNTTTIILQALIFTAAAGLVAAAVYVIVRLIKSAIARLRGGVGGAGGYYINDRKVSRFAFTRSIIKSEGKEGRRKWKRYRRLLRARRK